jgi:hypothetical protein
MNLLQSAVFNRRRLIDLKEEKGTGEKEIGIF